MMGLNGFMRRLGHKSPFSVQRILGQKNVARFGQPAFKTHPHLLQDGEVMPGVTKDEFINRRTRLMQLIKTTPQGAKHRNHVVIVPSATKVFMTHDIPYQFRQNSDFLYLCGFMEPNSVLILESGTDLPIDEFRSTIFVPRKDGRMEMWDGKRSGIDGAVQLTGVDRAYNTDDLGNYFSRYLRDHRAAFIWYDHLKPTHNEFHQKYICDFLRDNKYGYVEGIRSWVQTLRTFKSRAEIALMTKSCQIASKAFEKVMQFSQPKVKEAHLQAKMDFECRLHGAEYLAYPPVVAGGNRANTIHYVSNNQIVEDGEMVLMDAGCEYHSYTSDITRTWPVSGFFSDAQREIYEAVLEVQEECLALCGEGLTMDIIFYEMLTLVGRQLQRLRVLPSDLVGSELQRAARDFCPHHVGHYLGMDVHDTDEVSRSLKMQPGMVVTIEPGFYFPESNQNIPKEFRGIGIRIEDDVLITKTGFKNLTELAPKHPDAIEKLLAKRQKT